MALISLCISSLPTPACIAPPLPSPTLFFRFQVFYGLECFMLPLCEYNTAAQHARTVFRVGVSRYFCNAKKPYLMPHNKMLENTHKTTASGIQHFPEYLHLVCSGTTPVRLLHAKCDWAIAQYPPVLEPISPKWKHPQNLSWCTQSQSQAWVYKKMKIFSCLKGFTCCSHWFENKNLI